MLLVSDEFKTQINNHLSARKTYGRIDWKLIDITSNQDVSLSAFSTQEISNLNAVIDENYLDGAYYSTLENNRWKLDGSALLPETSNNTNIGWWSDNVCDSSGVFSTPETITFTFTNDHDSAGWTIIFDTSLNEYATNFTIVAYDASNNIIDTVTETSNTDVLYSIVNGVSDYRKIILTINEWSTPYRRARVQEFIFGLLITYDLDNKLIEFNVSEEVSLTNSESKTNEMTFSIDNSDQAFDILNPTGLYSYVQQQQKIDVYCGIMKTNNELEYTSLGKFYMNSWIADPNNIEISFKCTDIFTFLQGKYRKGLYQTDTLYNLILDVLSDSPLSSNMYNVDDSLDDITVTTFQPLDTYKNVLQKLAMAGMCVMYQDRNGILQIKSLPSVSTDYNLSLDISYELPKIDLDFEVKQITVNVIGYTEDASSSQLSQQTISVSGTQEIWVEYTPATTINAVVSGGTLNSATYYTSAALLNITASGNVTITITGKKLTKNTIPTIYSYNTIGQEYSIDNSIITSVSQSNSIAAWLYSIYSKKNIISCNWWGNPYLELTDIVNIETLFGYLNSSYIYKQTYVYNGSLNGNTYARG